MTCYSVMLSQMEQLFMNVNVDIKLFVCLRCKETISMQILHLFSVTV